MSFKLSYGVFSFFNFMFFGVLIGILIFNLEKIECRFESLKGIGIHFFLKPIGDRLIENGLKLPHAP